MLWQHDDGAMTFLLNIWNEFLSLTNSVRAFMPASTEFWSGIIGAVVGGGISDCGQLKVLRETRNQRRDDRGGATGRCHRADLTYAHIMRFCSRERERRLP
jgi:hypothetical protein